MDNVETLSDCSESSRNSEGFSSDVSTFSSLSEYQNEFRNLKHLVSSEGGAHLQNHKIRSATKPNVLQWYENQIEKLNLELKNSLKQNDKYKNDIINLEKKKDVFYSEKIDSLLKQNTQLNENLSAANQQIQRLISICHRKDESPHTVLLEEKLFRLEKSNQESANQNYLLSNKIHKCELQKSEIENEYKSFKAEFNAFQLDLAAKIHSIDELKKKISEQHMQIHEMSQANVKLTHSLDLISNELEHARKSENWYKSELREVQHEKNTIYEKTLESEKIILLQDEKLEQLKLELNTVKCACDEIRLTALKEKENMLKQLEFLDKQVTNSPSRHSNNSNFTSEISSLTKHYESMVNDLTNDVVNIKADFEHQQKFLENVSKEKHEMLKKYISLQNCLKDKDNFIKNLQSNINNLKQQISFETSKQKEQASELLDLKQKCAKLETELSLKTEDNKKFEDSVNTIREQFKAFSTKHVQLKQEIFAKRKEVLQLQYDKQQSCLNSSQQAVELQQIIEHRAVEIEKLKQKIIDLESIENDMKVLNFTQLETIDTQNVEIQKLRTRFDEIQMKLTSLQTENLILNEKNQRFSENTVEVFDVLNYLCKLCKIDENDVNSDFVTNVNKKYYIEVLLKKIQSRIERENAAKKINIDHKKKTSVLKGNVIGRIAKLAQRCKELEAGNEENSKLLKTLNYERDCSSGEEIQRLQTLLQVKTQEEKDKQKRYERNYRTLLRKVKEHMKGRKVAEKHNTYLQELHNSSSNKTNTLKLQLDLKNTELAELQSQNDNLSRINEKLRLSVSKLEKSLSAIDSCRQCNDFDRLKIANKELQQTLKKSENNNAARIADLNLKNQLISTLQKENEQMFQEISSKKAEHRETMTLYDSLLQRNKQLSAKLDDYEKQLTEEKSSAKQLKQELVVVENNCKKLQSENHQLTNKVDHLNEKNVQFDQQLNHLNLSLQRKSEEVGQLQSRKENSVVRWQQKETNLQNLISDLKNQLHVFKAEISAMKNEKFFLQRLCNDLKIALKTQVTQNKNFKECMDKVLKERKMSDNSIILSNFPSPVKNDDGYIERLLEENQNKPFCDIQDCLSTLRKEILFLQKQISDKNVSV